MNAGDGQTANNATNGAAAANGNDSVPLLAPEERERLQAELIKTEEEINTLRQVLSARVKHSSQLKRKLGVTAWDELSGDVNSTFRTVKDSEAFHRTEEIVHTAADTTKKVIGTVGKKLGDMRESDMFKSVEGKVGTAYTSVKAKIAASTSMDGFGSFSSSKATTPGDGPIPENGMQ